MKAAQTFSFTWHPYAVDANIDYTGETSTLVQFNLKETPGGTLLTVIESGFAKLPQHRYAEAFRMNEAGWEIQIENINKYAANK